MVGVGSDCPTGSKPRRFAGKRLKEYLKELGSIKTEDILDLNAFKKKGSLLGNDDLRVLKRKSKDIKPSNRRVPAG
jgi:hypothetical protein